MRRYVGRQGLPYAYNFCEAFNTIFTHFIYTLNTIALLKFDGYWEIYTIMHATDEHVALEMDKSVISGNTAL